MIEGILRSVLNHRSELTAGLTRKSRRRHTEGTNPQQPAEAPTTGRFIGKGIGRLSGDSGGWRLWKDRRHGFTLRTEHTSYNSSAAAFSSEKTARLRRCAETQKHFAQCRDLLTKWRADPFCGKMVIGGMQHDGTPKQTNGNFCKTQMTT